MDRHDLLNASSDIFKVTKQQKVEIKNLLNTLKHIENRADAYAVHEKGTCNECDALHEILFAARKAINFHSSVSGI
jgi:uncharacterized protein YyaL (SSP411 family)